MKNKSRRTGPGMKQKPMPSTRRVISDLQAQVSLQHKQLQQISMKVAQDLDHIDRMTRTSWEYLWGLIELLRNAPSGEQSLAFLTDEAIDKSRDIVLTRWKAEAFEGLKAKLSPGQGACSRCHHVDGGPNFFAPNTQGKVDNDPKCPNCGSMNTLFLKDTAVDATKSSEVAP